jgi:hypothetical protein
MTSASERKLRLWVHALHDSDTHKDIDGNTKGSIAYESK